MPQRIMGIDVGSWSVKTVLLEDSFRGFSVVSVNEVPLSTVAGEDPRQRRIDAIRIALGAATGEAAPRVDAYVSALPAESSLLRFITLPFHDARKVDQTIAGELVDLVPFELEEAVYHHAMVKKTEDGGSLSIAAIAKRAHLAEQLGLLQAAGADPRHLGVDALQLYNLYTHFLRGDASKPEAPSQAEGPELSLGSLPPTGEGAAPTDAPPAPSGPPEGRLLVDIGHERTLLAACGEDGVVYQRAIRTGGAAATRALAGTFSLSLEQAEALKHAEGFVASSRHPAPSDDMQQISDVISAGLSELVRELRRSLQAIRSEKRLRITRIDVLGGGSRIRNLPNYLAEQLNVPAAPGLAVEQIVERHVAAERRSAFAAALAYGLRVVGDAPVSPIDLRVGDFQFAGQLLHFRQKLPVLAASAALVVLLLGVNVAASYNVITRREKAVDAQFCAITKQVIGREICEPKQALLVMSQPTSELGNVALPAKSALDVVAELSHHVPDGLDVKIEEININTERALVRGDTTTYDAVDQIVAAYAKDNCYKNVKKGNLRKNADGSRVEFELNIRLECS